MNAVTGNSQSIALKILQSGVELPPFPALGGRLLAVCQQPLDQIDIGELVRLIETDPSLVTKLLQLANSVYFGTINRIISLRQAVVHIGLEETVNAVSWLFYQKTLPRFPDFAGFTGKDYWQHSWACAIANRMLGRPELQISPLPGELYLAGLLHGIGKLILILHRPDDFLQCMHNARDFGLPLAEAELDLFGTTDAHVASEILRCWKLPENICMAVQFHQHPEQADTPFKEIAAATQFAYVLANTSGIGNNGDEFSFRLEETVLGRDPDSPLSQEAIRQRITREIRQTLEKKARVLGSMERRAGVLPTPDPLDPPSRSAGRNTGERHHKTGILGRILAWLTN